MLNQIKSGIRSFKFDAATFALIFLVYEFVTLMLHGNKLQVISGYPRELFRVGQENPLKHYLDLETLHFQQSTLKSVRVIFFHNVYIVTL